MNASREEKGDFHSCKRVYFRISIRSRVIRIQSAKFDRILVAFVKIPTADFGINLEPLITRDGLSAGTARRSRLHCNLQAIPAHHRAACLPSLL